MNMTAENLDALILEAASAHFTKVAVIIAKTYDAFEAQGQDVTKDFAAQVAERIYALVDAGKLQAQGNMRRWREGDVRLAAAAAAE